MEENTTTVNVNDIRSKFTDKNSVHLFLSIDFDAFLPAPKGVTIFFLRALIDGSKKVTTNE